MLNEHFMVLRRIFLSKLGALFNAFLLFHCYHSASTPGYCTISESDSCLQIPQCSGNYRTVQMMKYSFNGGCVALDPEIRHEQEILPGGNLPYCTLSGAQSEACQTSCGINGTHTLTCGGDPAYCGNYSCSQSSFMCYCQMTHVVDKTFVEANGDWQLVTSETSISIGVYGPVMNSFNRKLLAVNEGDRALLARNGYQALGAVPVILKMQAHEGDVLIDIPITPGALIIRKISSSLIDIINITAGGQYIYRLPEKDRIISGDITGDYYYNGNLYASGGVYFNGNYYCRLYTCFACQEAWETQRCIPWSQRLWMYLFFAFMGLFLLLALPLVCCGIDVVLWILTIPLKIMTSCGMVGRTPMAKSWKKNLSEWKSWMTPERLTEEDSSSPLVESEEGKEKIDEPLIEEKVKSESVNSSTTKRRVKIGNKWYIIGMIMLLPLVLGDCSSSTFTTATFNDCTNLPNGDVDCNITLAIQASLFTTGASSCFLIQSANGTSEGITIEVKHAGVIASYDYETMYYTSSWIGGSQSSHRCWLAGDYCKNNNCENLEAAGVPVNAWGELSTTSLMSQPGRTGCRRSCGGGCTSCFFTNPGCVFYRYAITPSGNVYSVNRPINLKVEPYVWINITSGAGSVIRTLKVSDPLFGTDMRAYVVGVYNQPVESFAGKYIVKRADGNIEAPRICGASNLNQPQPFTIGDIQASTAAGLVAANTNAFAYATGLQTANQGSTTQSYSWVQPGFGTYSNNPALPSVFSGSLWTGNGSKIQANLTNPSAIVVGFELLGGLRVTRVRNLVCPSAELVTVGGCYRCINGSAASVRLKSTCKSGPVYTEIIGGQGQSLLSEFVSITTDWAEYPVYFYTDAQVNTFTLRFFAEGGNSSITVEFSAWPGPNVTLNNTVDYTGNQNTGPGSGWNFGALGKWWDDFVSNKLSTVGKILTWVAIVGAIIAVIVGLVITVTLGGVLFTFAAKQVGEIASTGLLLKNLFGSKSEARKEAEKMQ